MHSVYVFYENGAMIWNVGGGRYVVQHAQTSGGGSWCQWASCATTQDTSHRSEFQLTLVI